MYTRSSTMVRWTWFHLHKVICWESGRHVPIWKSGILGIGTLDFVQFASKSEIWRILPSQWDELMSSTVCLDEVWRSAWRHAFRVSVFASQPMCQGPVTNHLNNMIPQQGHQKRVAADSARRLAKQPRSCADPSPLLQTLSPNHAWAVVLAAR